MAPIPWGEAVRAWAYIAGNSFGGPAGQIAVMHRVLVEEERWISEERFLHALNYCMLLPGPEATQLVTWIGFVTHGYRGGLVAGWLFVFPGFVSILAMSAMYVTWNDVPAVAAAFLGLKAAVLAVVVEAMVRIGRRVLSDVVTVGVAVAAFLALFVGEVPFPLVILVAALLGLALPSLFPPPKPPAPKPGEGGPPVIDQWLDAGRLPHVDPRPGRDLLVAVALIVVWLAPVALSAAVLGPDATMTKVGTFFAGAATVTFGGAYSVLAYVGQQAVEVQGWLQPGEMLDGLGLAETTPGPLIQVVQFVGFLATYRDPILAAPVTSAVIGSLLTTWVTFWPSFLFVLSGGPYVERIRKVRVLASGLRAVTCAVVGVVANLAVWLSLHVLFRTVDETHVGWLRLVIPDWRTADALAIVVAVAAGVALLRFKAPMVPVLIVSALVGLVVFGIRAVLG